MKSNPDQRELRQAGKGFIVNDRAEIAGRILTQIYVDQKKRAYVKINGEIVPLTEQHDYLAA